MSGVALGALAAWLTVACIVWLWAGIASARLQRRQSDLLSTAAPADGQLQLLVLRPCAGFEPGLARALASTAALFDGTPFLRRPVIRTAVASSSDAAYEVAKRETETLARAGFDAELVITGAGGPNRKVAQLARACELEEHFDSFDLVAVVDSDVDLTTVSFDALLEPFLRSPRTGATWAPPVERGPSSCIGDRASEAVLAGSLHAFPLLSGLDPAGMVGKISVLRRVALEDIGGFAGLVDYLGEDFEIAERLTRCGYRVKPAATVGASLAAGRSLAATVLRFSRWMRVVRAQRPALLLAYPVLFLAGSGVATGAAILAVFADSSAHLSAAMLLVSALLARTGLAALARRRAQSRVGLWALVVDGLLADLVIAGAFFLSLRSTSFEWRGVPLRIEPGGRLRRHLDDSQVPFSERG